MGQSQIVKGQFSKVDYYYYKTYNCNLHLKKTPVQGLLLYISTDVCITPQRLQNGTKAISCAVFDSFPEGSGSGTKIGILCR